MSKAFFNERPTFAECAWENGHRIQKKSPSLAQEGMDSRLFHLFMQYRQMLFHMQRLFVGQMGQIGRAHV